MGHIKFENRLQQLQDILINLFQKQSYHMINPAQNVDILMHKYLIYLVICCLFVLFVTACHDCDV